MISAQRFFVEVNINRRQSANTRIGDGVGRLTSYPNLYRVSKRRVREKYGNGVSECKNERMIAGSVCWNVRESDLIKVPVRKRFP